MIPIIQLAKSHLILLALILAVASFAGYLFLDRAVQHEHDATVLAQHQLLDVQKANSDLQAAIAKRDAEIDKRDALLEKAIASRNTVLIQQQKADAQLPPTELASRLVQLSGAPVDGVKAQADGSIALSQPASVVVTGKLEEIPTLEANVGDLQTEIADRDEKISERDKQIVSDKQVLAAQIDADHKKYKELETKARRSKLRWFAAGVVAGFVGRTFAHF